MKTTKMMSAIETLNSFTLIDAEAVISASMNDFQLDLGAAKYKDRTVHLTNVRKSISIVNAVRISEELGLEQGNQIAVDIMATLVQNYAYLGYPVKNDPNKIKYGRKLLISLQKVLGENHELVAEYIEVVVKLLTKYAVNDEQMVSRSKKGIAPKLLRLNDTRVKIIPTTKGLLLKMERGTEIAVKGGSSIKLKSDLVSDFGTDVINPKMEDVLNRVLVHEEMAQSLEDLVMGKKRYNKGIISYIGTPLIKLMLLKANGIDLTRLYEERGTDKFMVLTSSTGNNKLPVYLTQLPVPGFNFPEKYLNSVSLSLSDAKGGVITRLKNLDLMLEYVYEYNGEKLESPIVYSREPINKTLSRLDKLFDKKGWTTKPVRILVVNDITSPELFKHLGTGPIAMPDWWLKKYGMCRVITNMNEGGIKAVTTATRLIDPALADQDLAIIGVSAFKGNMLAAAGMLFKGNDFLHGHGLQLLNGSSADARLNTISKAYDQACEWYTVAGVQVKGTIIELPLIITNAYTVEAVVPVVEEEVVKKTSNDLLLERINKDIDAMEKGDNSVSGFRDQVMHNVINGGLEVGAWLDYGLATGELQFKKSVTRITTSEIQSVSLWHGKGVANSWLQALAEHPLNKYSTVKRYGSDWIQGIPEQGYVRSVKATTLLQVFKEGMEIAKQIIKTDSKSYPFNMVQEFIDVLTSGHTKGWIRIEYPCGNYAYVPCGSLLTHAFDESVVTPTVVTKGLLAEVLENLKGMIDSQGDLYDDSSLSPKYLNAVVQTRILGKEYGYQYTTGFYGIILPHARLKSISDMALTRRDRITSETSKSVRVNSRKHPVLFYSASAGFYCSDARAFDGLCETLLNIFAPAVFMHPEAILIQQNDADGDGCSVSIDGYNLPLNKSPAGQFNGKYFTDFIEDEQASGTLKMKHSYTCDLKTLQLEINKAVNAKDAVGKFTAAKYIYEAVLPNVTSFTGKDEIDYTLTNKDRLEVSGLLNMLVQLEAMDNMKQSGTDDFISDLINPNTLNTKGTMPYLRGVIKLVAKLMDKYDVKDSEGFAVKAVMTLHHIATTYPRGGLVAMNVMSNSRVRKDNFKDIAMQDKATGAYDFFKCYTRIMDSSDKQSMYREIVLTTINNLPQ